MEEEQARRRKTGPGSTGPMMEKFACWSADWGLSDHQEIGVGGMGVVYRARHISSDFAESRRRCRPKVIHQQYVQNSVFRGRFVKEAALRLRLSHPAIVSVHELIVDSGVLGLVMELVEGQPLSDLLDDNPRRLGGGYCIEMMETILKGCPPPMRRGGIGI